MRTVRKKKKRRDVQSKDLVQKKKRKTPMKFLLRIMNSPKTSKSERVKIAKMLLPYFHTQKHRKSSRKSKPVASNMTVSAIDGKPIQMERQRRMGKKEHKLEEAQRAAVSGRFRPLSPPSASGMNGAAH